MCRVLLVEDNEPTAAMIRAVLDRSDISRFDVVSVSSMRRAISALNECYFDAIVLDLFLPDSSGVDTVRTIREECPDIPLVVSSYEDDPEVTKQCILEGADDFVLKSFINFLPRAILKAAQIAHLKRKLKRQCRETAALACRYQCILDATPDWIVRTDPAGTILYANRAAREAVGLTEEEMVGRSMFDFIDPQYRQLAERNHGLLSPDSPVVHGSEIKVGDRWISWLKAGIFDAEGNLIEIQSIGRDTTGFLNQLNDVLAMVGRKLDLFTQAEAEQSKVRQGVISEIAQATAEAKRKLRHAG